jgi:hypothetical protein
MTNNGYGIEDWSRKKIQGVIKNIALGFLLIAIGAFFLPDFYEETIQWIADSYFDGSRIDAINGFARPFSWATLILGVFIVSRGLKQSFGKTLLSSIFGIDNIKDVRKR